MDNRTGVSITMPASPNLFTTLMIILLRFVNLRAGMNFGIVILSVL